MQTVLLKDCTDLTTLKSFSSSYFILSLSDTMSMDLLMVQLSACHIFFLPHILNKLGMNNVTTDIVLCQENIRILLFR